MRKITLLLALVCGMSMFAERYLVQLGTPGAATWRTPATGETLVNLTALSQTFNAWYGATVVANDEVWVAAGSYVLAGAITVTKANHSMYGGFAGTENLISERAKTLDGNAWGFTNETLLDGNNAVQVLLAAGAYANVIFDGLTITKSSANNAAAQYRDGVTLQNCKVVNNLSTGNGGGVNFYNGGSILNSYIANNVAPSGGGLYSNNASTSLSIINGCLFENNRANGSNGGGAIRVQGTGNIEISNCVLRGNKGLDNNGTTSRPGAAIYTNSTSNKFTNCLIYNNSGSNVVYFNGGNFNHVNIVNNVGQVYIAGASAAMSLTNSIVWGNKTDATGATNTGITSNTTNKNVVINNTAISPSIAADAYTQADNITLEYGNDSPDLAKGPGFVNPTTFWGAPSNPTETSEFLAADWSIKYSSGLLNLGKTLATVTTDLVGTTRPQGAAYDMGAYELAYFNTTVTFNAGGTVNALASGDIVSEPKGQMLAFTITPNSGMKIASVTYKGVEVKDQLVEGVYTAPALTANAALAITFDVSTGVEKLNNGFRCFSVANSIEVHGLVANQMVELYSISGARIATQKSVNDAVRFTAQKGIYIVKVADKVNKVVVD